MRVLVTGGAGFIGSNLVQTLVRAQHDVFVVDDLSTGSPDNIDPRPAFQKLDILSPEPAILQNVVDESRHLLGFDHEELDLLFPLFVELVGIIREDPVRQSRDGAEGGLEIVSRDVGEFLKLLVRPLEFPDGAFQVMVQALQFFLCLFAFGDIASDGRDTDNVPM